VQESFIQPRDETDEYSFENLYSQGLEMLQQLSGDIWTDYNLHDPGVTILEQLCFALTDIIYRSDTSVSQLLVRETGRVDFARQGLFGASKILSSGPVIPKDYEAIFFDKIPELENIFLDGERSDFGQYRCIPGLSDDNKDDLQQRLAELYHSNRPLCQKPPVEFREADTNKVEVAGTILIENGFSPEIVLAEIFLLIQDVISPKPSFTSYDDFLAGTDSLDSVLEGPYAIKGRLNQSSKGVLLSSAVVKQILYIEGIKDVVQLKLLSNDKPLETVLDCFDEAFELCVPLTNEVLQLQLVQNNKIVTVQIKQLLENIEKFRVRRRQKNLGLAMHDDIFPNTQMDYWPLNENYPVFDQLPSNYRRIAYENVSANNSRGQVERKQINAYLMLFEQFIVNSFANLHQLKTLISVDDFNSSYFFQPLEYSESRRLYLHQDNDALDYQLKSIIAEDDNYLDRRNRILDYLLGLYAESFPDQEFLRIDNSGNTETVLTDIVRAKIKLLKHIPVIGFRRSLGQDFSKTVADTASAASRMSGVQLKSSLMLGIWNICQSSLLDVFHQLDISLTSQQNFDAIEPDQQLTPPRKLNQIILAHSESVFDSSFVAKDVDLNFAQIKSLWQALCGAEFLQDKVLGLDFIAMADKADCYRILELEQRSMFLLIFKAFENQWFSLGQFPNRTECLSIAERIRQFLFSIHQSNAVDTLSQILEMDVTITPRHFENKRCIQLQDIFSTSTVIDNYVRENFKPALQSVVNNFQSLETLVSVDALAQMQDHGIFQNTINEDFLRTGIETDRYRIGHCASQHKYILAFRFGVKNWVKLAECDYANPMQDKENAKSLAMQLAVKCQQLLYALNRLSEGMHIVEANLIDPQLSSSKPQIHVIMPNWPVRFHAYDFQQFAEKIIQQCCPAHILFHLHWVNVREMEAFEHLYNKWCQSSVFASASAEEMQQTKIAICRFMRELQDRHGVGADIVL
jgi:hypothetical protein